MQYDFWKAELENFTPKCYIFITDIYNNENMISKKQLENFRHSITIYFNLLFSNVYLLVAAC